MLYITVKKLLQVPVSRTQQLPLPQLHGHVGAGQVDKLHEGNQGATERGHTKGLKPGALAEVGAQVQIRGVGRQIGDVQGERWRVACS